MRMLFTAALLTLLFAVTLVAQPESTAGKPSADIPRSPIESITIHPLFAADHMCSEHWEGQLAYPGDALGSDCVIFGGLPTDGKGGFMRSFRTNGLTNEDWYGWQEPVLAPFAASVERININSVVNKPGELGKPPASFVIFKREDGTRVLIAHVADVTVKEGDRVTAGQPFAKVGNNGFSRSPHIHVGAWREKTPLQIQFDLRAAARLVKK